MVAIRISAPVAQQHSATLTAQDLEVFFSLERLLLTHVEPPTFCELADEIGIEVIVLLHHLRRLRLAGCVTWDPLASRTFRILARPTCFAHRRMA